MRTGAARHMDNSIFTSLTDALQHCALYGLRNITVTLTVSSGRVTAIVYRKTFNVEPEESDVETTREIDAVTVLLRRYAKFEERRRHTAHLQFAAGVAGPLFVDERLARWIERKSGERETVPVALVQQVEQGTEAAVEETVGQEQRRSELQAMPVVALRKLGGEVRVAGAWRLKKAELIEAILQAGGAA